MEHKMIDSAIGKGIITCYKYRKPDDMNESTFLKLIDSGIVLPYETLIGKNIWLTTGWTELLKLITGASTSHFDTTNTTIGVGNDATAVAAGQTDLIGASKTYKGMSSGYPTTPSTGTVQFKARFLTSEANYAHNELVVKNTASGVCWNRNATGWGTKTSTEIFDYLITLGTT